MKLLALAGLALIIILSGTAQSLSTDTYEILPDEINAKLGIAEFTTAEVFVENKANSAISFQISASGNAAEFIKLSKTSARVLPGQKGNFTITAFGKDFGTYRGIIRLLGSVNEDLPLIVEITEGSGKENMAVKIKSKNKKITTIKKL